MIESAEEFVRLRTSEVPKEYWRAAHEDAPESVWLEVIRRFPEMREWVAHNKSVPAQVLMVLIKDPDPRVRRAVAMINRLTSEMFEILATDLNEDIRAAVCQHKKAPRHLLEKLSQDPSEWVSEKARVRLNALAR